MNRQIPAYIQLAETIKGRILRGEYRFGELISAAKTFEKQFGVSNITVRKAFDLLVRQGYLESRQGVGTQIVGQPEELVEMEFAGNFWDWADSAMTRHLRTEVEILEITTAPCPKNVREQLNVAAGEPIWRMKRLRRINGQPASFIINHVLPVLMQDIDTGLFRDHPFLDVLQKCCGMKLSHVEQRVRAATADLDVAGLLGIDFGDPLFFVQNTYYDRSEKPVEVSHLCFRGDRYLYKAVQNFQEG